jgi:hypothetical protein
MISQVVPVSPKRGKMRVKLLLWASGLISVMASTANGGGEWCQSGTISPISVSYCFFFDNRMVPDTIPLTPFPLREDLCVGKAKSHQALCCHPECFRVAGQS